MPLDGITTPRARPEAGYGFEGSRSPWCSFAKGWGGKGGRHPPTGPASHWQGTGQHLTGRGQAAQPQGVTLSPHTGAQGGARGRWASTTLESGEPEPGLGEGDVGRRLFFQVPKAEVTTPAPCGAGGWRRAELGTVREGGLPLPTQRVSTRCSFPAHPPPRRPFSHLLGAPPWGGSGSTCGNPDRSHHKTAAGPGG